MCGTKSGTVCGYAACTTTVLYVPEKKPVKSSTRKTLTQIRVINTEDAKPVFSLSMQDGYVVL